MSMRAVCTWGEAEDVTIVGKHSNKWADRFKAGFVMLMEKPLHKLFPDRPKGPGVLSGYTHGMSSDWQLSMSADEALELAASLVGAANQAKVLDKGFSEALDEVSDE